MGLSSHNSAESQEDAASVGEMQNQHLVHVPGKRHNEADLLKRNRAIFLSYDRKVFKYLDFFTCLLLPSFSSFAYGFVLDLVACWSPLLGPLPRSFGSCIPF